MPSQDAYGRNHNTLIPVSEDLYYFAPVPIVYHEVDAVGLDERHAEIRECARKAFSEAVLEVPDVRHINDLGDPPESLPKVWSEQQNAAVGVWHRVPTNSFLSLQNPAVAWLRNLIITRYQSALAKLGNKEERHVNITESWIQFYKNTDYKVLHNHERYGPPYPLFRWAGSYYVDDGAPDPTMPYSGVLSFRVREQNYLFRPKAGLLLLWPSEILHEVHPFYGERNRIAINFNISCE